MSDKKENTSVKAESVEAPSKFEQMLEKLVADDRAGADDLFHEIVVEDDSISRQLSRTISSILRCSLWADAQSVTPRASALVAHAARYVGTTITVTVSAPCAKVAIIVVSRSIQRLKTTSLMMSPK